MKKKEQKGPLFEVVREDEEGENNTDNLEDMEEKGEIREKNHFIETLLQPEGPKMQLESQPMFHQSINRNILTKFMISLKEHIKMEDEQMLRLYVSKLIKLLQFGDLELVCASLIINQYDWKNLPGRLNPNLRAARPRRQALRQAHNPRDLQPALLHALRSQSPNKPPLRAQPEPLSPSLLSLPVQPYNLLQSVVDIHPGQEDHQL